MPISNRVESPRICPRCKVVLPPYEITCYSCGFQLTQKQPNSTSQPAQSSIFSSTGKGRSRRQSRGVFVYFISVSFVVLLFAFLLLRAAGITLSSFFPFLAATRPTASYPVPKQPPPSFLTVFSMMSMDGISRALPEITPSL